VALSRYPHVTQLDGGEAPLARLAQNLEAMTSELWEFIQEVHAAGQRLPELGWEIEPTVAPLLLTSESRAC
jgi:hypothetical protein